MRGSLNALDVHALIARETRGSVNVVLVTAGSSVGYLE